MDYILNWHIKNRLSQYRQSLMGFAILWVFMLHTGEIGNPLWDSISSWGWSGVDMFLFLSAIGLCYSLNKDGNLGIIAFYKRRAIRILPPWLLGLLSAYNNMFDIPYTVFRICVPFGNMLSKDYSFGTIGFFLRQAQSQHRITLYGNGEAKRTFTSMSDLCRQIERALAKEQSQNQIFNIGGCTHSLYEVAKSIADHYNAELDFVPFPDSDRRIESGSTFFDSTKIEQLTGFSSSLYEDIDSLFIEV